MKPSLGLAVVAPLAVRDQDLLVAFEEMIEVLPRMKKQEGLARWMLDRPVYPVVIYNTRYGGLYEGCEWAAFNLDVVPEDAYGDDETCSRFWGDPPMVIGKGSTPNEAHQDLVVKIKGTR